MLACAPEWLCCGGVVLSICADCWVVVDGQVLDVTKFLNGHPGGPAAIEKYTPYASIGKLLD